MCKTRPDRVWLCVFAVATLFACHKPRSEGYRRIELFSTGKSSIEFTCLIGIPADTHRFTTPWSIELDLDTMGGSWPDRCRVSRANPGPDKLWVWASDRDSLRLARYLATQFDTVGFLMQSWICYQGKP
ncbi:hypothetical protein FJY68_08970 [candidate division WOR-3 bacterium]|uniref:Uncharacterized protein n=1 Tax=candidate division WOR-3 bacterium TaxID=2052148 RepID=A0A938BTK4_UNCW3|nr:hypothetical protein [candidate division WOR-3 bacterium]